MRGTSPLVHGIRQTKVRGGSKGIVFSLERGQVWASWDGDDRQIYLGPEAEVAPMMQDFLAQVELGRKLTAKRQ